MAIRLTIYLIYYAINVIFTHDGFAVLVTLPMMAIVLYHVVQIEDRYFTLWDMVHFLMYLFFVIEPLQMIDHGRISTDGPISAGFYTNTEIGTAMAIATVFYAVVTAVIRRTAKKRTTLVFYRIDDAQAPALLALVLVSFLLFVVLNGGIGNVLSSRFERHDALVSTGNDAFAAFIAIVAGIMTGATFVLASQIQRRLNVAAVCFIPTMFIILLCFNPFNTSRFSLLATYVPLIFVIMKGKVPAVPVYAAAMFGIVVLMPILSTTTRFGLEGLAARGVLDANLLHLQFVDTFDLLVECVRFVEVHGYAHGMRLLADIVVYVPRAMWRAKPTMGAIDIGQGLVDARYFGTFNVSQLVAADGYMDFGFFGVVLVGLLVGLYLRALFTARRTFVNGYDLVTFAFVSALPILLRGPLTAVISIYLFQSLTIFAARKVLGRRLPPIEGWEASGMGIQPIAASGDARQTRPNTPGSGRRITARSG